jgi:hypothetical protein
MTLVLTVLAITFLVGVLIGCSLTERALDARTRRQAAMQRALNSQWQELEVAQSEYYIQLRETAVNAGYWQGWPQETDVPPTQVGGSCDDSAVAN